MKSKPQLDAATPAPTSMVYGKGMALNHVVIVEADIGGGESLIGSVTRIFSPRSVALMPRLCASAIPSVQLLGNWPSGKGWLVS